MGMVRVDGVDWDFAVDPVVWAEISAASRMGRDYSKHISWRGEHRKRIDGRIVYVSKLNRITFVEHL